MKFFCEYCGNRIDAEKHSKCPHCGASYKKNKDFIKLEQERNKENQLNNEYKQKIFNHVFSTMKFSKYFLIVPILIFIITLVIFIAIFINTSRNFGSTQNEFDSMFTTFDNYENI